MSEAKKPGRLLESSEAARIAGCSPQTIVDAANAGRLAVAFVTGTGRRLFEAPTVEAWAASRPKTNHERFLKRLQDRRSDPESGLD